MKIIAFLILSLMVAANVYAAEPINLDAIAQIESSGNPLAVGDHGRALGLYQLHAAVVKDFNRTENASFTHAQVLEPNVSRLIANWYINTEIPRLLRHFKQADSVQNHLIAYNCGIDCVVRSRIPKTTKKYILKYMEIVHGNH